MSWFLCLCRCEGHPLSPDRREELQRRWTQSRHGLWAGGIKRENSDSPTKKKTPRATCPHTLPLPNPSLHTHSHHVAPSLCSHSVSDSNSRVSASCLNTWEELWGRPWNQPVHSCALFMVTEVTLFISVGLCLVNVIKASVLLKSMWDWRGCSWTLMCLVCFLFSLMLVWTFLATVTICGLFNANKCFVTTYNWNIEALVVQVQR